MGTVQDGGSALLTLVGSVGTIIISMLVAATTGAWRARGIHASLEKNIDDTAAELRKEAVERQDDSVRQMGEGLAALRQKATDMELWNRDNFVRRAEFQNAVDSFTRSIDSLRADIKDDRAEIKGEYVRLNEKLDQLVRPAKT